MTRFVLSLTTLLAVFLLIASVAPVPTHADSVSDIQAQIDDINRQRAALDAEIKGYQKQLDQLGAQHQTLQGAISSIDVSRSKTATQIKDIQQKIAAANLKLSQLSIQITDKEQSIALDQAAVAKSLRDLATADDTSFIEDMLAVENLTQAWVAADNISSLNEALRAHTAALSNAKLALAAQHQAVSSTKTELSSANTELGAQKKALDVQRAQKDQLLSQTKSQESSYQSLIATKKAQEAAFEAQLTQLESQLKSVNSTDIPHAGSGILAWPFTASQMASCATRTSVFGNQFCITQYFGNTAFAASGAYNGKGHNGIDIGVPTGTPIEASLSGTVMGTGNTDAAPGCYSFGKWVAVKHANGLATVYAHLSSISVSAGQSVSTGDLLGYSGMTGYATGPHLHYGVYAVGTADAPGIQISTLSALRGATTPCARVSMPIAPLNAYLNPISYL